MKPLGPIPPGFPVIDGELAIGGRTASALVAEAGTPLFVYDAGLITARVAALRAALPERLGLHYAMKANPFAPVLQHMAALVDGFDIASGGELVMAEAAGVPIHAHTGAILPHLKTYTLTDAHHARHMEELAHERAS